MNINSRKNKKMGGVALVSSILVVTPATATTLLSVEFREDDQDGFDIWPTALSGTSSSATFATPENASGNTTVEVVSSTTIGQALNRPGSVNGTPVGFTYQNLFEDLLIASSPTGLLTLNFSDLDPNGVYILTLYAWDPADTTDRDRIWTVQSGTGVPESDSVNYTDVLVDNDTHSMLFEVTATGSGTFSLSETTANPQGSAINGFVLEKIPEPSSALLICMASLGLIGRRRR